MRRFDLYFLSEMIVPSLLGLVLMLMLLIGNQLYGLLHILYGCAATPGQVGMMLLYYLPAVVMLAVPAALLLGASLSLNRLERDRELLAFRMTGVRLKRLVLPILLLGVGFSGILFLFQESVIPRTTAQAKALQNELIYNSPTGYAPQDQYFMLGASHIYIHRVDTQAKMLYNVLIWKPAGNGGLYPTIISIPRVQNIDGRWYLQNDPVTGTSPRIYNFDANGEMSSYMEPEGTELDNWLDLTTDFWKAITTYETTADELTLRELLERKNGLRGMTAGGIDASVVNPQLTLTPTELAYYLHQKLAAPLAALVALLIAVPLAVRFGRSGGYMGLLLAALIAFFFVVSGQWARVLAETGHLNPIFAAWGPDALFGLIGLALLLLQE